MVVVAAVVMVKLLGGAVHVSPCGMAKSAGYWGTTSAAILYLVVREVLRDRDFLHTGRMQPSGCWNSPTDQSHETRRTHARKKLVARGTYRALLFFVYSSISRYTKLNA
jgi:hypothetical protein